MADTLRQDDIDSLLGSPFDDDDESVISDIDDAEPDVPERISRRSLKGLVKSRIITVPYVSPVLKSDGILFDPDINGGEDYSDVPVVRSLLNYKQYKKINCK